MHSFQGKSTNFAFNGDFSGDVAIQGKNGGRADVPGKALIELAKRGYRPGYSGENTEMARFEADGLTFLYRKDFQWDVSISGEKGVLCIIDGEDFIDFIGGVYARGLLIERAESMPSKALLAMLAEGQLED